MTSRLYSFRWNASDPDEARAIAIVDELIDSDQGYTIRQIVTVAVLALEGQQLSAQAALQETVNQLVQAVRELQQMAASGYQPQAPAPQEGDGIDPQIIANFKKRVKRHTPD